MVVSHTTATSESPPICAPKLLCCVFWLTLTLSLPAMAADRVNTDPDSQALTLAMPLFPPFTHQDEWGNPQGHGYLAVKQLLDRANIRFDVRIVPNYGRALAETRSGQVDGFFLASRNSQRDAIAEFSGAIVDNPWSWFSWSQPSATATATPPVPPATPTCSDTIATLINTNTHQWLSGRNCGRIYPVHSSDELVHLLLQRKVDRVFVSQPVMLSALQRAGVEAEHVHQQVETVRSFGLYLSHTLIRQQPQLMKRIQQVLSSPSDTERGSTSNRTKVNANKSQIGEDFFD
jgi:hypothetical protein